MADPVDILKRIAFGLEFQGQSSRRISAYSNGARTLKKIGRDLPELYDSGKLADFPGIGKSILTVVGLALTDQPVPLLEQLRSDIPEGIWTLRGIRGVGAKKIKQLHRELGITNLAELEYACNENRLIELKGFGPKSQAKVLEGVEELKANMGRWRQDQAFYVARTVRAAMGANAVLISGDIRRGTETIADVQLIAVEATGAMVVERLSDAGIDATLDTDGGLPVVRAAVLGTPTRVYPCAERGDVGVAHLLTTGPDSFIQKLQTRAAEVGQTLGPAGLFEGASQLATDTEDAVFEHLGLWPTPPERRDDAVPVRRAQRRPAKLVRVEDLRGALHNHTTASDGIHSLAEMRQAATALGWEYLGISEHSQTAAYAGGLVPDALLGQVDDIAAANAQSDGGAHLLSGVESDILREGQLDYTPEVMARLDFVVASSHNRYRLSEAETTARMVAAARSPWADIMGHPTGRLLLGRRPNAFDVEAMLDACAESGCAVELNANPQRLDLNDRQLAMARERGVLVSISPDAHSTAALNHVHYGVLVARRAGLTPDDVLNCMPLDELRTWLHSRKERASAMN